MTKQLIFYFVLTILSSCSEKFRPGNVKKFNALVAARQDIKTPEELITLYYDPKGDNNNPGYKITTKTISKNNFEITLIHTGIGDDSVYGEKVILNALFNGSTWTVSEIKENCKCQTGRGHQDWSAEPCN